MIAAIFEVIPRDGAAGWRGTDRCRSTAATACLPIAAFGVARAIRESDRALHDAADPDRPPIFRRKIAPDGDRPRCPFAASLSSLSPSSRPAEGPTAP